MPKRDKGYLVPEDLHPLARRCVKIYIPDEPFYIANFWGALTELSKWFNYEKTGDDSGKQAADLMRDVIQTAMQFFDNGTECALPLQMRRNVSTGDIEWRPDGEATWQSLGAGCECSPDVAVPSYTDDGTIDERACAIAVGLTEWLFEKFLDTIDAIEANVDAIAAFDAITAVFSVPAYIIADQVFDVISEIVEAGAEAARAFDTIERREEIAEYLYCTHLREMTPPEMTLAILEDWKAWMGTEYGGTGLGAGLFLEYRNMLENEAYLDRAAIASHGEGNCAAFECAGWVYDIDFTIDNGASDGWTPVNGAWESGVGWKQIQQGATKTLLMYVDIGNIGTVITSVRVVGNVPDEAAGGGRGINYPSQVNHALIPSGAGDFDTLASASESNPNAVVFFVDSIATGGGAGKVTFVRITGTGVNPFV